MPPARDGAAIQRRGFSVFCYGLCMKGTVKETLGTVGQPIVIGGIAVHPGDIVSADDDGVVVVPRHNIAAVVMSSAEREVKEAATMEAHGGERRHHGAFGNGQGTRSQELQCTVERIATPLSAPKQNSVEMPAA